MAAFISIKVLGDRKLQRKLKRLPIAVQKKGMRKALGLNGVVLLLGLICTGAQSIVVNRTEARDRLVSNLKHGFAGNQDPGECRWEAGRRVDGLSRKW